MNSQNYTFMFYGFTVAWLIVIGYVISIALREKKLRARTGPRQAHGGRARRRNQEVSPAPRRPAAQVSESALNRQSNRSAATGTHFNE